jgi:hypothetical protein
VGLFGSFVARLTPGAGGPEPGRNAPRPYDDLDRREQLLRCAGLGTELADLHARHDHPTAAAYRAMSDEAQALLDDGFDADQLRRLARLLPGAPDWMNPKAIDSGLPVQPWQPDAADLRARLADVALELRATARYGDAR